MGTRRFSDNLEIPECVPEDVVVENWSIPVDQTAFQKFGDIAYVRTARLERELEWPSQHSQSCQHHGQCEKIENIMRGNYECGPLIDRAAQHSQEAHFNTDRNELVTIPNYSIWIDPTRQLPDEVDTSAEHPFHSLREIVFKTQFDGTPIRAVEPRHPHISYAQPFSAREVYTMLRRSRIDSNAEFLFVVEKEYRGTYRIKYEQEDIPEGESEEDFLRRMLGAHSGELFSKALENLSLYSESDPYLSSFYFGFTNNYSADISQLGLHISSSIRIWILEPASPGEDVAFRIPCNYCEGLCKYIRNPVLYMSSSVSVENVSSGMGFDFGELVVDASKDGKATAVSVTHDGTSYPTVSAPGVSLDDIKGIRFGNNESGSVSFFCTDWTSVADWNFSTFNAQNPSTVYGVRWW